jgi:hypothetical protein
MRALRIVSLALAFVFVSASISDARPRPTRSERRRFESNKNFGLGLELGDPFALCGKYWLGEGSSNALDFGLGDIYGRDFYYENYYGLYLYLDYLWHPLSLASTDAFELPFYIGVGPQFWNWTYYPDRFYHGNALGVRVPIGLSFDFNNVPIDIFIQIVPNAFLLFGGPGCNGNNPCPDYIDVFFSFGVRYYFS